MHSARRRRPFPWPLLIGSVLLAILLTVLNYFLLEHLKGGREVRFLWEGLRVYWFSKGEVYLQARSWPLESGFEQATAYAVRRFDLPLPFLLLLSPLALLPSAGWAAAFLLLWLEIAVPVNVFVSLRLAEWPLKRFWQIVLILLAFFWPYAFFGLWQTAPFWFFLILLHLGLLALRAGQEELAGALWALLTLRWEATLGVLIFLTLYLVRARRWRVLAGAGMLLFLLYNVAFLVRTDWFLPFLRAVAFNLRQGFGISLVQIPFALFPVLPSPSARFLSLAFWLLLFLEGRFASEERPLAFYWALNLSLSLTPLLGLRTDTAELTMLFPSLILILALTWKRWPRYGVFLPALLALLALFVPWALWRQALAHPQESRWEQAFYLFPVLFSLIGLYWMRWSLFRPRTWLDRVRSGDVM